MSAEQIIAGVVAREGGFVDHPADRGGPTNWGITEKVARDFGYVGPMRDMPRSVAEKIYLDRYYHAPGFHLIAQISLPVADELTDTGVNMGPAWAARFLQRSLNALNRQERDYPDMTVDGQAGPVTRRALKAFLDLRGRAGLTVLLRAMNILQGARYIDIAERDHSQEAFVFGWIKHRVTVRGAS